MKAYASSYLLTESIGHRFLRSRDDVLISLQNTSGFQLLLLAPPLRFHHQLCLVEGVRGGGVRGDGLDDDAVAGAEPVGLGGGVGVSRTNKEEEKEERTHTDRQAVEDDVFVGSRRGACR